MSRARSAAALAAVALVLAVAAILAVALAPNPGAQAAQPGPALTAEAPTAVDPFLATLLGEGTEAPANAGELLAAADRVCEGLTAGVDLLTMQDGIAAEFAVSDEDARRFVNVAASSHCRAG